MIELLSVVVVLAFFGAFYWWFLADWVWERDNGFVIFIVVTGFLAVVLTAHGIWEMVRNKEFVCRLDWEAIECSAPSKWEGQTFKLPVAHIVKIEKCISSESRSYYLWDQDGQRYWLNENFGNPASKFVAAIRELNPAVIEIPERWAQ